MTTVGTDLFGAADAWLDGIPFQLCWKEAEAYWWIHPYQYQAPDVFIERTNESEDLAENKLDSAFYGSNRSWHKGAGQKRLHVPKVSDPYAYLNSKGVDISTQGQLTLLHSTSLIDANSYTTQLQKLIVANDQLFMVGTTAGNLRKIIATSGAGSTTIASGVTGDITGLATDGVDVYSCDGDKVGKSAAGGAGAEFGTNIKATVLEWAKDQLFAAGPHYSSPRHSLFTINSSGTPTEIYKFPVNLKVVQMCELGPLLYIAVQSTVSYKSWIYAYDGTNAPFIALPMPDGDMITSMTPFLGAGMLIGAVRQRDTGAQPGVVYIGFPQGQGHIVLLQREIVVVGDTDSTVRTYTMARGVSWGKAVYFPWPYATTDLNGTESGIGVYYPEFASYGRHLHAASQTNLIGGIARWKGRMFFTVQGSGLYAEQTTYLSSGNVISSVIDLNNDVLKLWFKGDAGFDPLPANTSVQLEYSTDNGTTWTSLGTVSTLAATLLEGNPYVQTKRIQYRLTLASSSGNANTPVVTTSRIGGWPISAVKPEHILVIRAYPRFEFRTGQQIHNTKRGWDLFDQLAAKRANGTVCDYQPPWWRHSNQTLKVRVSTLSVLHGLSWGETGDEVGGPIQISLKEI